MTSPFRTDHVPNIGVAQQLGPDLRVVTAPNSGPMTFTGTQTYLLGEGDIAIVDPGPDDVQHFVALRSTIGGARVSAILITHSHVDHSPMAARLSHHFQAPIYGYGRHDAARAPIMASLGDLGGGEGIDLNFAPDFKVADGEVISGDSWSVEVVHLPGHLSNHIGFATDGRLLSGDHVMGWATTLISPPDGDLTAFMASLDTCLSRSDTIYYPGHGAPIENPKHLVTYIRDHRKQREAQIVSALASQAKDITGLTAEIYADVDQRLHGAASRNVLAHIIDLFERKIVFTDGKFEPTAMFRLN